MDKRVEERIRSVMGNDYELRRCYEEHAEFERQLATLSRAHLSAEEELERKRLQKLKLAGMDRMQEILRTRHAAA